MRNLFKQAIVALLTLEAKAVLRKYQPHIVAITGSVGKTSTKDAIYSVLAPHVFVRKSEKSFNSEVGIPLTILGRPNAWNNPLRWLENLIDGLVLILFPSRYPEWLVLEVGADRPGDISSVAKWLPIDVAVITRLPDVPVHVEFFDSPEEMILEKASLLRGLTPMGVFVANADDPKVLELRDRVPGQSMTYGFSLGSDIHGSDIALLSDGAGRGLPAGISATISCEQSGHTERGEVRVMGTLGTQALLPVLAAAAVGHALGFRLEDSLRALSSHLPPPGRMRLIPGIKDTLIIDDTYNASPAATLAALDALTLAGRANRTIAVLGDMLELGRYSVEQHKEAGKRAAETCTLLCTVGFRARDIAEGALSAGMPESAILQFEDAQKAGKYLEDIIQPGDVILIKGSQSIRMERAVEEIMQEPERAGELLVRQEREWKRR
jgi:UDP-N-acetylmuramyl pentapeptide synthase